MTSPIYNCRENFHRIQLPLQRKFWLQLSTKKQSQLQAQSESNVKPLARIITTLKSIQNSNLFAQHHKCIAIYSECIVNFGTITAWLYVMKCRKSLNPSCCTCAVPITIWLWLQLRCRCSIGHDSSNPLVWWNDKIKDIIKQCTISIPAEIINLIIKY